jgi:hypothetical protein
MKNILVTQEQLDKLVNVVKENHQGEDSMAKKQLFTIATLAYKMWESMEDNEQLEDWEESKIAQCEQSIIAVVKNYMYDEFVDDSNEQGGMDKLNYDDLVIGK